MQSSGDINVHWLLSVLRQAAALQPKTPEHQHPQAVQTPPPVMPHSLPPHSQPQHQSPQHQSLPAPLDAERWFSQAEAPLPCSPPAAVAGSKRGFGFTDCLEGSPSPVVDRSLLAQFLDSHRGQVPPPQAYVDLQGPPPPHSLAPEAPPASSDAPLPSLPPASGLGSKGSKGSLVSLDDVTRGLNRSLTRTDNNGGAGMLASYVGSEGNLLRLVLAHQQQVAQQREQQLRQQQQQQQQQHERQQNVMRAAVEMLTLHMRQAKAGAQGQHLQQHQQPLPTQALLQGTQQPLQPLQQQAPSQPQPQHMDYKSLLLSLLKGYSQELQAQSTTGSLALREGQRLRAQAELQQLRQIQNLMWDLQCLHSQSMPLAQQDVNVNVNNSPAPSSCSGTKSSKRRRVDELEVSSSGNQRCGAGIDLNCDP